MNPTHSQVAELRGQALPGATDIRFEALGVPARAEILAHFRQLSAADLALRFSATMSDIALERYVDSLDFIHDTIIAARSRNGEVTGIAQLIPVGSDRGGAAEVAFSLVPAARGKGLGSRLMREAVAAAQRRGITHLFAQVCPRNAPMLAILRHAGMTLAREDCEMVGSLALANAGD